LDSTPLYQLKKLKKPLELRHGLSLGFKSCSENRLSLYFLHFSSVHSGTWWDSPLNKTQPLPSTFVFIATSTFAST
jgi:hypothetical protein